MLLGVAQQYSDHLRRQLFGALAELLPGQVFDGMLGVNGGVISRAPHLGHSRRRGDEPVGANGGRGYASVLHVNSIVHTARAAGASITHRHDHRITAFRQLTDGGRVGRL